MNELTIFVLAVFVGFEVISKVPVVLHTPLMSGTNAIHGIVVIGGILVLGRANGPLETILGFKPADKITVFRVPGAWEADAIKILSQHGVEFCDRSVSISEAARRAVEKIGR